MILMTSWTTWMVTSKSFMHATTRPTRAETNMTNAMVVMLTSRVSAPFGAGSLYSAYLRGFLMG